MARWWSVSVRALDTETHDKLFFNKKARIADLELSAELLNVYKKLFQKWFENHTFFSCNSENIKLIWETVICNLV